MRKSLSVAVAVAALTIAACITGCHKEAKTDAQIFAEGMQSIINSNQPTKHVATINATTGGTIIGANTRLQFWGNAFTDAAGNIVTGNVQIELQEFYKKPQMVLANKTTGGTEGLLDSRGEAYINYTQNGTQLRLRAGYGVIYFNSHSNSEPMNIYTGRTNGNLADITWDKNTTVAPTTSYFTCVYDTTTQPVWVDSSTMALCDTLYSFPMDTLHWNNCDYFVEMNYPNLTDLTMGIPSGYDNNNTTVYVVFKPINSVFRVVNFANQSFILDNIYKVPVNMQATIVALNYHNGGWYSCFKDITISAHDVETLTFTPTTIADYVALVNSL